MSIQGLVIHLLAGGWPGGSTWPAAKKTAPATRCRRLAGLGLATIFCTSAPALLAAPAPGCRADTALATLIANPAKYHGQRVSVLAYVTIEFEYMNACPSLEDTQTERCLWLEIDDGPHQTDADYARYQAKLEAWAPFSRQRVAFDASFDATRRGHFSMWPGALVQVGAPRLAANQAETAAAATPRCETGRQ